MVQIFGLQTRLQHQSAVFPLAQRPAVPPGSQPASDVRLEQHHPLRGLLHHQVQVLHVVILEEHLKGGKLGGKSPGDRALQNQRRQR